MATTRTDSSFAAALSLSEMTPGACNLVLLVRDVQGTRPTKTQWVPRLRAAFEDNEEILLHIEARPYSILYAKLVELLEAQGLAIKRYPTSVETVARALLTNPPAFTAQTTGGEQAAGDRGSASTSPAVNRAISALATRFADPHRKYAGEKDQSWEDYFNPFSRACSELQIPKDSQVALLHHILKGDALRYYENVIEGRPMLLAEASRQLKEYFLPLSRQSAIFSELAALNLREIQSRLQKTEREALNHVTEFISKRFLQIPQESQTERQKMLFLRDAMVPGADWAKDPVHRAVREKLSFQILKGQLEEALDIFERERVREESAFFQDRYLQDKTATRSDVTQHRPYRSAKSNTRRQSMRNRRPSTSDMNCFNCGSAEHLVRACPKPFDPVEVAARRAKAYRKKHVTEPYRAVLFELAHQWDDPSNDSDSASATSEDEQTAGSGEERIFH